MSEAPREDDYSANVVSHERFGGPAIGSAHGSGGGGDGIGLRVTRLEEWSKLSDARFSRVEDKLDILLQRLAAVPSRADLVGGLAVVLAVVGLLIAGLGWLETRAARVQPASAPPSAPIIVQLPSPAPPPKVK